MKHSSVTYFFNFSDQTTKSNVQEQFHTLYGSTEYKFQSSNIICCSWYCAGNICFSKHTVAYAGRCNQSNISWPVFSSLSTDRVDILNYIDVVLTNQILRISPSASGKLNSYSSSQLSRYHFSLILSPLLPIQGMEGEVGAESKGGRPPYLSAAWGNPFNWPNFSAKRAESNIWARYCGPDKIF